MNLSWTQPAIAPRKEEILPFDTCMENSSMFLKHLLLGSFLTAHWATDPAGVLSYTHSIFLEGQQAESGETH